MSLTSYRAAPSRVTRRGDIGQASAPVHPRPSPSDFTRNSPLGAMLHAPACSWADLRGRSDGHLHPFAQPLLRRLARNRADAAHSAAAADRGDSGRRAGRTAGRTGVDAPPRSCADGHRLRAARPVAGNAAGGIDGIGGGRPAGRKSQRAGNGGAADARGRQPVRRCPAGRDGRVIGRCHRPRCRGALQRRRLHGAVRAGRTGAGTALAPGRPGRDFLPGDKSPRAVPGKVRSGFPSGTARKQQREHFRVS